MFSSKFQRHRPAAAALVWLMTLITPPAAGGAAARAKVHTVTFGAVRRVPYSAAGDPAGNNGEERELKLRRLLVDGKLRDWTTGETHDVTERSVAVRRALKINDTLPGDQDVHPEHWIWQRGPWLLIDRTTGKILALRLPDFDPSISRVSWFRDLAAYCGLSTGGRQLYAVVAQVAGRKPLLLKKIAGWEVDQHQAPCAPAAWQRNPLQVTFALNKGGALPVSYQLVGSSAVLVEGGDGGEAEE